MDLTEKTLSQKTVFNGRIINLRVDEIELPNGEKSTREVIEHNGGACIVALTDNDEVLLVKQYRYAYGKVVTEIPAGKIEKGEDPLDCASRELVEETGYSAKKIELLGEVYPSPGYCGETIYIYKATELCKGNQHLDEDEFLDVIKLPLKEAYDMIVRGELCDSKTICGILRVYCEKYL